MKRLALLFALTAAAIPQHLASLGFGRTWDCQETDWRLRVGDGCTAAGEAGQSKRCAEIQVTRDGDGYAVAVDGAKAGRLRSDSDLKLLELRIAAAQAKRGWTRVRPATYACTVAGEPAR